MVDDDDPGTDTQGTSHAEQAPGGGSSRGPEFGTPGEVQVPVPPYDELRGEPGANTAPQAFDASNAPEPGPDPAAQERDHGGVSATDTNPEPALGVGRSRGGRGEDQAPDRHDVGTKGSADRPVGKAAEDDSEGVGTHGAIDPGSPDLQAGDQGG